MRLRDKITLVTGGGSGIGRAISVRFAQEGANVVVSDIAIQAGKKTVELAQANGGHSSFLPVDVTNREDVSLIIERVKAQFGRLDTLVNSAGIAGQGRIEEVSDDLWDRVVAVNLSGVFWACRYAIPLLLRSGGGVILNLASSSGLRGAPESVIYSATKGGVVMLSRSLAAAYANQNIRVWAICPTAVDTALVKGIFGTASDPDAAWLYYESKQPMGRMITTDEVASLAVYLASNERFAYTPEPFVV